MFETFWIDLVSGEIIKFSVWNLLFYGKTNNERLIVNLPNHSESNLSTNHKNLGSELYVWEHKCKDNLSKTQTNSWICVLQDE